ncbi:26S proteasome non-ATPase regulatory subunit 9-like [Mytilus trossulus]|uniref:26S proteasome non-ATPase regulatory subunit 9-like n=1 Tax=Mytilus trossulus TaxID=6551 RepID=UPI003006A748
MAAPMENMNRLVKKKEEIEADIQALFEVLKSQKGVGMKEPLVDKDGFPRNDIDIHTVRTARHDINCLQNDHLAIMTEIEEELYKIHEVARANNPQRETMDTSDTSQMSVEMKERLSPFLEVNKVDDGSPASTAQLQEGDKILQFGSITAENFKSLQDIASVVQHSKGKPLTLTVSRSNTDLRLSLTPNTWSGKGLLGCNIVPLKKS